MEDLVKTMGLGEIPIINHVNEALHNQLIQHQLEIAHLEAQLEQESDDIGQLYNHVEAVEAESATKKYFIQARREELEGERDILKISANYSERNTKENLESSKALAENLLEVETLEKKLESAQVTLDLMNQEHYQDQERIQQWNKETDNVEKDIYEVLKFHFQDENHIKESNLKISKLQMQLNEQKSTLDESSTINKMTNSALLKAAQEFRKIHAERQEVMCKWSEAIELAKSRDSQIQGLFDEINKVKEKGRRRSLDLKQQLMFLTNEKVNIAELDLRIKDLERQINRYDETLKAKEQALEDLENEITLEDRLTMKAGAEIASKRKRIKELKHQRNALKKRKEALEIELGDVKQRQFKVTNSMLSAEDKAKEMDKILTDEEKRRDIVQWDLDIIRQKKVQAEQELKEVTREEAAIGLRHKALKMERAHLTSKTKNVKGQLTKKEDLASAAAFKVATLERELDQLQGKMSIEARSELKKELEVFKEELEARKGDKRNMDHLLHKIEADVRKISREIENLTQDVSGLVSKIKDVSLQSENSKKRHSHWHEKLESLILEEKLLLVSERKAKEELNDLNQTLLDLNKEMIAKDDEFRRKKSDLESQKESLQAQHKHMKEDMRLVKQEIRKTQEQSDLIKIRYDHMVKSLGESKTFDDKKAPSHAFHLVQLAQEKAELKDQANVLEIHLQKEERELLDLQKTMALLRNSNDKYRASHLRRDTLDSDEVRDVQEKIKSLNDVMEKSKNELEALEAEIKLKEFQIIKLDSELEMAQSISDERSADLEALKIDIKDQELKLERAKRQQDKLSNALKAEVTNAHQYEHDMDLRTEKEKQRGTLIKLRELSIGDPKFSTSCQSQIEKLGLPLPTLSRLEMQSSSGYQRRSFSASRDNLSSTRSSATKTSFYRRSAAAKRTTSMTRSSSTNSLLVMEMNHVAPPMDIQPIRTQLPIIN